jgi:hypothetical protein
MQSKIYSRFFLPSLHPQGFDNPKRAVGPEMGKFDRIGFVFVTPFLIGRSHLLW